MSKSECPECGYDTLVKNGKLLIHTRKGKPSSDGRFCAGSGKPPVK